MQQKTAGYFSVKLEPEISKKIAELTIQFAIIMRLTKRFSRVMDLLLYQE